MLLNADELPGGTWRQIDERTWRTGISGRPWAQRASDAKSVTAWRSFENAQGTAWLWCQVVPTAAAADAKDAAMDVLSNAMPNTRAEITVIGSRDVTPPDATPAEALWAHEQDTTGPRGMGTVRYLTMRVGHLLGVVCASGEGVNSDWDTVASVARTQAARMESFGAIR